MKTKLHTVVLMLLLALSSFAQFDFGDGAAAKQPWEYFKLPKTTLKLDFRNASIDMVLALYTKTSGVTIVKDPALNQPITLTTAKAVPLDEAFEILNAALSVRNAEMKREGKVLVVRAKQQRGGGGNFGSGTSGTTGFDPAALAGMMGGNTELKVYRISFANASQVARVINDVFAQQFNPLQMMTQPGVGGGAQPGGFGRGRGGGFSRFGNMSTSNVKASSDDYSNSVIVNAPKSSLPQIEDLIKQIDKQTEYPLKSKVYRLNFASSDDLQPVVQNVLQSNVPRGRGGTSSNTPIDRQFSFLPFFGGNNNNRNNSANGSAISDVRTNSLIVTTTEDNQKLVDDLIKELDTEVKFQATTFVVPLANARADQMSTLLRQAFGTRQGMNTGQNNRTTTGTTGNNNTTRRTNPGTGNNNRIGGGTGLGGGNAPTSLEEQTQLFLDLADPSLESGDLATDVTVNGGLYAQIGGGQFGQPNTTRRNQAAQTGRDTQGRVIQVQDLTGQVTVIPDSNTNSIIVVTTPENAALISQIVNQLDKIPEQVMIETIIVEASLDSDSKLGVEWSFVQDKIFGRKGVTGSGIQDFKLRPTNAPAEGFRYTLTGADFSAFLNALQTDTKFNVLSTPRIFTSNNVQAQINISQRVPFVVSQRTDANGNITFNYDFEDVGIVLTVTPRITSGGYVTMDVSQTANDLQGFTSFNAPIVNQRQADTTVAVKDGETIILGGIIRNSVSTTVRKIPLLGDIPLLGNIFRTTDKSAQKTELLVFLTPRVVRNPEEAAKLTEEQAKKLSKPTQEQLKKAIGGSDEVSKVRKHSNDKNTKKEGGN